MSLGDITTGTISAGGSISLSKTVTIPSGTAAGTYYIWAVADNGSVLNQVGTGNDYARASALTVTVDSTADYPSATWIGGVPASNYENASRTASDIKWIVIHTTEGTAASAISWFQNGASQVSAHYLVKQDGTIVQLVRDQDIAYQAGNYAYNQNSIGIEHERSGSQSITAAQMPASANLVKWLFQQYGIFQTFVDGIASADPASGSGIIGHNQVPDPNDPTLGGGANHHTDPVSWDWTTYESLVVMPTDPTDDAYENNDSKALVDGRTEGETNSPNLGLLSSVGTINGLRMADREE